MNRNKAGIQELLEALAIDLSEEEVILAGIKSSIAAAIAAKRLRLRLSQKDFAKKMNVTQGLVSRWERGETNFTLETLVKISQVLDIEIQYPFADKPRQTYACGGNIIAFPGKVWNIAEQYSTSSYEVKEM